MMEPKGIVGACECARKKWIPVEERLPEEQEWVLVVYESYGQRLVNLDQFEDGNFRLNNQVTHWMPLPDPPK